MSVYRKAKPFFGHPMSKMDHRALISLIGFTSMPFGVPKRGIRSEGALWAWVDAIYSLRPAKGQDFITAMRTIRNKIAAMTPIEREMYRAQAAARFEANGFPEDTGIVAVKGRQERKPRAPRVRSVIGKPISGAKTASKAKREDFYKSWEWRTLRMTVLKKHGPRCMCCGSTPDQTAAHGAPVRIVVDHIKPLYTHWHLRLDANNLQVLCDECNMGKGAWDTTDWRADETELSDEPMSPIEQQLGERFRVITGGAAA